MWAHIGPSKLMSFLARARLNAHFHRVFNEPWSKDTITYAFYGICLCVVCLSYFWAATFTNGISEPKKIKTEIVSPPLPPVDPPPPAIKSSVVSYNPFTLQEKKVMSKITSKIDKCMQKTIASALQKGLHNKVVIKKHSDAKCMATISADLKKEKISNEELHTAIRKYADVLFDTHFGRVIAKQ